jgi:hypothetical protein
LFHVAVYPRFESVAVSVRAGSGTMISDPGKCSAECGIADYAPLLHEAVSGDHVWSDAGITRTCPEPEGKRCAGEVCLQVLALGLIVSSST